MKKTFRSFIFFLFLSLILCLGLSSHLWAMGNKPPAPEPPKYKLEIHKVDFITVPDSYEASPRTYVVTAEAKKK